MSNTIFNATYISTNSFSVPTDVRYYFLPNIAITVECGGVWVFSYVESASYGSDITTVTLKTSVLSSPCGNAEIGIHPYMVPWHPHDESVNSGGLGVMGSPPSHEWNGTQIRFRDSYEEWGSWVDLQGVSTEYIGAWSSSPVDYLNLNIVTNDGSTYICTLAHTSGGSTEPGVGVSWQTVWALLAPKGDQGDQGEQGEQGPSAIIWLGEGWDFPTYYAESSGITYNGSSYVCWLSHTSSANDEPGIGENWFNYWQFIAQKGLKGDTGLNWIGPWSTPFTYNIDDAVSNAGDSFICISYHDSGVTSEPGVGVDWTPYWELFVGGTYTYLEAWTIGHSYAEYDVVTNDGSSYGCISDHTADATTEPGTGVYWATYWFLMAEQGQQGVAGVIGDWIGPWEDSFGYILNDCVSNDGSSYVCIDAHTSDATTEPGVGVYWATYWEIVAEKGATGSAGTNGIGLIWLGAWSGSSVGYVENDTVSNSGSSYICTSNHTSDATTEPGTGVYWASYWDVLVEAGVGAGLEVTTFGNWAPLPTDDSSNGAGVTHRQICQAILVPGNRVRVRLQGHSTTACTIDHASIGIRTGSASATVATPVELLFSGGHGCSIPIGGYIWSDWAILTVVDSDVIVVVADINSSGTSKRRMSTSALYTLYYKTGATYSESAPSGMGSIAGLWMIQAINVKTV